MAATSTPPVESSLYRRAPISLDIRKGNPHNDDGKRTYGGTHAGSGALHRRPTTHLHSASDRVRALESSRDRARPRAAAASPRFARGDRSSRGDRGRLRRRRERVAGLGRACCARLAPGPHAQALACGRQHSAAHLSACQLQDLVTAQDAEELPCPISSRAEPERSGAPCFRAVLRHRHRVRCRRTLSRILCAAGGWCRCRRSQ